MSSKVLLVVLLVVLMLDTIIKLLFLFFIIKLLHLRNLSSFHPLLLSELLQSGGYAPLRVFHFNSNQAPNTSELKNVHLMENRISVITRLYI